ncbi:hypothetical protein [Paenibacillus turpanensis]|uniref:hypothetical protein n=1 Tax=Paenibacillus turpanensis TaxID=2689078 RepID=UPI00140B6736|nr:hypothetical protein [Paenibacillus turpanensis]
MNYTRSRPVITKIAVSLFVGEETLVAVKDSAAATGYSWSIQPSPGIEVESEYYTSKDSGGKEMNGESQLRVFRIKPIRAADPIFIERIELLPPQKGEGPVQVIEVYITTNVNV